MGAATPPENNNFDFSAIILPVKPFENMGNCFSNHQLLSALLKMVLQEYQ